MSSYFKNLNIVGWIKWTFIIVGSVATFIGTSTEVPYRGEEPISKWAILGVFIAVCLIIPLGIKFSGIFYNIEIQKPLWNDNPYALKRPLIFFDFFGVLFLFAGISRLTSAAIYRHSLDIGGLILIAGWLGALFGINLAVKWSGRIENV